MFHNAYKIEISESAIYIEVSLLVSLPPGKQRGFALESFFIHANEFLQYLKVTIDFASKTFHHYFLVHRKMLTYDGE